MKSILRLTALLFPGGSGQRERMQKGLRRPGSTSKDSSRRLFYLWLL